MFVKVFFLGRPGSGKSTAARHMIDVAKRRNYSALYMKDYDILYQMFQKDHDCKQFRPTTDYDGFDVLDNTVFDAALKKLEKDILAIQDSEKTQLMVIEFARDDYRTVLKLFKPEVLRNSYIFFVDADLQNCIARIHKRAEMPSDLDHHFVSDYIMQTYYNKDNWMYVSSLLKKDYPFFKNVTSVRNIELLSDFLASVDNFSEMVFQSEFSQKKEQKEHDANQQNTSDIKLLREPDEYLEQVVKYADAKSPTTPVSSSSTSYKQYTDGLQNGPFALAP